MPPALLGAGDERSAHITLVGRGPGERQTKRPTTRGASWRLTCSRPEREGGWEEAVLQGFQGKSCHSI